MNTTLLKNMYSSLKQEKWTSAPAEWVENTSFLTSELVLLVLWFLAVFTKLARSLPVILRPMWVQTKCYSWFYLDFSTKIPSTDQQNEDGTRKMDSYFSYQKFFYKWKPFVNENVHIRKKSGLIFIMFVTKKLFWNLRLTLQDQNHHNCHAPKFHFH